MNLYTQTNPHIKQRYVEKEILKHFRFSFKRNWFGQQFFQMGSEQTFLLPAWKCIIIPAFPLSMVQQKKATNCFQNVFPSENEIKRIPFLLMKAGKKFRQNHKSYLRSFCCCVYFFRAPQRRHCSLSQYDSLLSFLPRHSLCLLH